MILTHGDVSKLKGMSWYVVELSSEKTSENTLRRLGRALSGIFKSGICEVFIPLEDRDIDLFALHTSSYIFIRTDNKKELSSLKTVTGVIGILCEGDQQRIDKAIQVTDEYVQGLITTCREAFHNQTLKVSSGSFVRILDGVDKGFCGTVISIDRDFALVQVELKTRQMLIETPVSNLRSMDEEVPEEQRVFYYTSLVSEFVKEYGEPAQLALMPDLKFQPEPIPETPQEEDTDEYKVKYGRQRTITALTKNLLYTGVKDPHEIIRRLLEEIKAGNIKKPKNVFILYSVLKQIIMDTLYKNTPEIESYKDVIRIHGEVWRFSPSSIKELDTENLLPLKSETDSQKKKTVITYRLKEGHIISEERENV